MTNASSAPPDRAPDAARVVLWLHAMVMGFLGLVGLVAAGALAELFAISSGTVRLVGGGSLVVGVALAVLVTPRTWRPGLAVAGGLNIILGGTLLGLAPSSPDNRGVTLLVILAVLFAILAMAEFAIRRPRGMRPPGAVTHD